MNSTPVRFAVGLVVALATLLAVPTLSLADDVPPAPDVTTLPATDLVGIAAKLHATVVTNDTPTTVHFEYGTAPDRLTLQTANYAVGRQPGDVPVTGAADTAPGATYYFRAVAENDDWTVEGEVLQFTTPGRPELTGAPTTDITYKSATLHVTVVTHGLPTTVSGSVIGAGGTIPFGPVTVTADGDVAFPVTGLVADRDIRWLASASSSAGIVAVRPAPFHTVPLQANPRLTVSPATAKYGTSVQLSGAVPGSPGLPVALHWALFPALTAITPDTANATTTADGAGGFAFTVRATKPASFAVTAEGYKLPALAGLAKLNVFPAVTAKVKRAKRHRFIVSGTYQPKGTAAKATLYRGGIVKVGTAVSTTGKFAFPARALKPGRYQVRIVPAASTGYVTGKSALVTVPRR